MIRGWLWCSTTALLQKTPTFIINMQAKLLLFIISSLFLSLTCSSSNTRINIVVGISRGGDSSATASSPLPPPTTTEFVNKKRRFLLHPPDESVDWDSFDFSLNGVVTDAMWIDTVNVVGGGSGSDSNDDNGGGISGYYSSDVNKCIVDGGETISLHPAATVLNYGQGLFEGLKAFRRADGKVALFRPFMNAKRMCDGARRFLLPPVPESTFVKACEYVVKCNSRWIPPFGKGALYLRPLLFGSGPDLGVKPSSQCTFCVYCSPVGDYFKKGGGMKPIMLQACKQYARAARGGSGGVKAIGNYAPCFLPQKQVRSRGYDEALFLDAVSGEVVEEAGASNFFAILPNNTLITPPLTSGTILPGITRDSIIELAKNECGLNVIEKNQITVQDLQNASEAFCCGTGASITPVGSVHVRMMNDDDDDDTPQQESKNNNVVVLFQNGKTIGPKTKQLQKLLLDIQMGTTNDEKLKKKYDKWIHIVKEDDVD